MITVITFKSEITEQLETLITHQDILIAKHKLFVYAENETIDILGNRIESLIVLEDDDFSKVREIFRNKMTEWHKPIPVAERIKIGH